MKMKYIVFLALLPCMLAAQIEESICSNDKQCPQGKYCCILPSGESGCCDLPKDLADENYVPGLHASSSLANVSMTESNVMLAYCPGTQCGSYCIPNIKYGVCCSNKRTACPSGTQCCGYSSPWCCKRNQRCGSSSNQCLNPVTTLRPRYCSGTQCGSYCVPNIYNGVCCSTPGTACPSGTKCCGNSYSKSWCCKRDQICSSLSNLCINPVITTPRPRYCFGTQCGSYCVSDVKNGVCCSSPGTACPSGTKCCEASYSKPWCCKQSQYCTSLPNVCLDTPFNCPGTQCGQYCIRNFTQGFCCSTPGKACPLGSKCCGDTSSYSQPWCCTRKQRCSVTQNVCINSAVTTATTVAAALFAFFMGMVSKYVL